MSEPIEFQILSSIKTALLACTVAGGYYYDVAAGAVKIDPATDIEALLAPDGPRPFIGIEFDSAAKEYHPSNQLDIARKFKVFVVHDSDPADDDDFMRVYLRCCADVERAIRQDPSRGGLAIDTLVDDTNFNTQFAPKVWTEVDLTVTLERTNGAP